MKSKKYKYSKKEIPIYGGKLHIIISDNNLKVLSFLKEKGFNFVLDEPDQCFGFAGDYHIGSKRNYFIWVTRNFGLGCLAHEGLHIVKTILEDINENSAGRHSEFDNYLLQYIVNEVDKLNEKGKPKRFKNI